MTGWFGGSNPSLATTPTTGAVAKSVRAAALYAEDTQVPVLPAPHAQGSEFDYRATHGALE
jgi:hypothetical protein